MKRCSRCKEEKDYVEFYNNKAQKDGLENICKSCKRELYTLNREKKLEYNKNRYAENKDVILEKCKTYHLKNKDKRNDQCRDYYSKNKEQKLAYNKIYYMENKIKIRQSKRIWETIKRLSDKKFRLRYILSRAVSRYIKDGKQYKSWESIVGYSLQELHEYLEVEKYNNDFHVDHIIPLSYFRYTGFNDIEFYLAWRLENLQILSREENLKKATRIDLPYQKTLLDEVEFFRRYPDMYRIYHSR